MSKPHVPTNKEIVAALEACLKYLSPTAEHHDGKSPMICFALGRTTEEGWHCTDTVQYIRDRIIDPRIHPYGTLRIWLRVNHGVSDAALNADNGRRLQTHRRQWVKRLIQEFSK